MLRTKVLMLLFVFRSVRTFLFPEKSIHKLVEEDPIFPFCNLNRNTQIKEGRGEGGW